MTEPMLEDDEDFYGESDPAPVQHEEHTDSAPVKAVQPSMTDVSMTASASDSSQQAAQTDGKAPQDSLSKDPQLQMTSNDVPQHIGSADSIPDPNQSSLLTQSSLGHTVVRNYVGVTNETDASADALKSEADIGDHSAQDANVAAPQASAEGAVPEVKDEQMERPDSGYRLSASHAQASIPKQDADQNVDAGEASTGQVPEQNADAEPMIIDEAESALKPQGTHGAPGNQDQPAATGPEVEADSSPYESSSDDSSDSSDDSDDDYAMLDPREQARLLMEDGGSDDEGGKKGSGGAAPRTTNEQVDEIVQMPDVEVTESMLIEELGNITTIISNVALIKAQGSAEQRVLDNNSLLCRADRKVIGVVSETIGRVEEPLYVVRFTNAATVTEFGLSEGTKVFYVPSHSNFLFTKSLQVKGSDASNLHDEEVADNEMEFSDDEAEAAYKASIKKAKRARKEARSGPSDLPQRPGPARDFGYQNRPNQEADTGPTELSYDENPGDELYTPLSRPSNLADMMRQGGSSRDQGEFNRPTDGNWRGRDFSRGRGRGDRGRGRGRGGDRGRGRGRGGSGEYNRGGSHGNQAGGPQTSQQPDHSAYAPQWQQAATDPNFHHAYPHSHLPPAMTGQDSAGYWYNMAQLQHQYPRYPHYTPPNPQPAQTAPYSFSGTTAQSMPGAPPTAQQAYGSNYSNHTGTSTMPNGGSQSVEVFLPADIRAEDLTSTEALLRRVQELQTAYQGPPPSSNANNAPSSTAPDSNGGRQQEG